MRLISLSAILIPPSRQRREFNPESLVELMTSISSTGLRHPITVRTSTEGHVLVAGERRLRAIRDIWGMGDGFSFEGQLVPEGFVPCVEEGEIDALAAEEMEYDENVKRDDLTWQERADATARLSALRARQAAASGTPEPSIADLALEVRGSSEGVNHERTRREIIVAKHLDDPEVARAKSLDDAFKALKRKEENERTKELGLKVGRTFSSALHRAINKDSFEWIDECDDGEFDVILTDPPFGIRADEFGDAGGKAHGAHGYEDSEELLRAIMTLATNHFARITKPQSHLYLFCDIDWFQTWRVILSNSGWRVHRTPLIWHKTNGSRVPWPTYGPQRRWEMLLYAVKGERPVNRIAPDVLSYPTDDNLGHSAQKPVVLFQELLSRSVKPGDRVLDPFCGTGTIFPAAHALRCIATGVEIDPASYGIAVERIQKLDQPVKEPA